MKAKINYENAILVQKLDSVKSSIPMTNASERKEHTVRMGNYRRFASKYAGDRPKLDPLVLKKVKRDAKKGSGTGGIVTAGEKNRSSTIS